MGFSQTIFPEARTYFLFLQTQNALQLVITEVPDPIGSATPVPPSPYPRLQSVTFF